MLKWYVIPLLDAESPGERQLGSRPFEFFAGINLVLGMKSAPGRSATRRKVSVIGIIYAVPAVMNVIGFGIVRWSY